MYHAAIVALDTPPWTTAPAEVHPRATYIQMRGFLRRRSLDLLSCATLVVVELAPIRVVLPSG